jgi:FlaA1/EpsC-like NDP-sugar epimerase
MTASPLPERIIIAGAGFAGRSLKTEIGTKFPNSQVVSFLDDDPALIGTTIDGAPVHGPMDDSFSSKIKADQVIIAIPSATRGQLRRIFQSSGNIKSMRSKFSRGFPKSSMGKPT